MKRRTLAYFVVLGVACAGAVALRAPYLPLAAFAVLETVLTYLERAAERRTRPVEARRRRGLRTPRT